MNAPSPNLSLEAERHAREAYAVRKLRLEMEASLRLMDEAADDIEAEARIQRQLADDLRKAREEYSNDWGVR